MDFEGKRVFYFLIVASIFSLLWMIEPVASAQEKAYTAEKDLIVENNTIKLPLKSVLVLALKNNLDIAFESYGPLIADTDVTREESVFDTQFKTEFTKMRRKEQVGNVLMGGTAQTSVYQQRYNSEVSLQKRFTPGTTAELKLTHEVLTSDVSFQGLNPQYSGEIVLSLTQPLLRDFGINIGKSLIKIANLNLEISQNQFKQRVMDILYQIESYYWNLYFRIEDQKSKEHSLKLAEDLLREFKIKIDAGTLAPIEIYQAEAEVAMRREDLIVSKDMVRDAEDNLKAALNLYEKQDYWDLFITPLDSPTSAQVHPDLQESVKIALEKRPDLNQAKLDLKASNIQVKYTKNQTLPRLDLVGSLGSSGLAGRPKSIRGVFGPFSRSKPSPWSGHWSNVYDGIGNKDYYSYMVGIKLEFPLENRLAKSQYALAKVQAARAITSLKNAENAIINEVREAVRQVETNLKRINAAEATLRLAREKLKAEKKKYKVGMSTAHDLLEFQEDLAQAESNLARTMADYTKSLVNLSRVKGTLLEEKDIHL